MLVGRRNASIDVYDLRNLHRRTLHLPSASGPVTALDMMPDGKRLVCGSHDVIRLWDLTAEEMEGKSKVLPYRVITTAHSGPIAALRMLFPLPRRHR